MMAGRLRCGRGTPTAPVLNDVTYTFGKRTIAGAGWVLAGGRNLGLVRNAGAGVSSITFSAPTTGDSAHWTRTANRTPVPAGNDVISGTYVFPVTLTDRLGATATADVTINVLDNVCTIGTVSANLPTSVLSGSRSATAMETLLGASGFEIHLATGIPDSHILVFNNAWTFAGTFGKIKFQYADPDRPSVITVFLVCRWGAFGYSANVHVSGSNNEIINCDFLNEEQQFYTDNNQFGPIRHEAGNNLLIDNNLFQHGYMFINAIAGTGITVTNNKGRYPHARPTFYGQTCDTILEENNVFWAPFRTQSPYDAFSHIDWLQSADAAGANVAKNRTAQYNICAMADGNTTCRGWVGGGNGSGAKPGTVTIRRNIFNTWGTYICEVYGFENASIIEGNAWWMVLTWGPGETEFNTVRNYFGLDVLCDVSPAGASNVGVGATLLIKDNLSSRGWFFGAYATTLLGSVITQTGNVNAGKTGNIGAPTFASAPPYPTDFVTGQDPDVYLRSFTDWADLDVSQWAVLRQRMLDAFERTDGLGPVAIGATGFNP
jgi:hypothetical protein